MEARMPKICTYTIKIDTGLAPNPFWGYCTLGLCTPNYMGMANSLEVGDWIVGHGTVPTGRRLVYAMEISETLDFDLYFHDKRFVRKKPIKNGTDKERCGDNIYRRKNGRWIQQQWALHGREEREKDLKHPCVIIARRFYYFGENAEPIQAEHLQLCVGRGCKYRHDPSLVASFLRWLDENHRFGVHGDPRDWPLDHLNSSCKVFDIRGES
jgi:hypothetical protein